MPSQNLIANVRLSFVNTLQAFRFANSALNLFEQVSIFGQPPNRVKIQRYRDALLNLMNALDTFQVLAEDLDIQLPGDPISPGDPIFPGDPVLPENVSVDIIIRLAQQRTFLAINRLNNAIRYTDAAISLTSDPGILALLRTIRNYQASGLNALTDAFNLSPFETDIP